MLLQMSRILENSVGKTAGISWNGLQVEEGRGHSGKCTLLKESGHVRTAQGMREVDRWTIQAKTKKVFERDWP